MWPSIDKSVFFDINVYLLFDQIHCSQCLASILLCKCILIQCPKTASLCNCFYSFNISATSLSPQVSVTFFKIIYVDHTLTAILNQYYIHCSSLSALFFVNCKLFVLCILPPMIGSRSSTHVTQLSLLCLLLVVTTYFSDTCYQISSKMDSLLESITQSSLLSPFSVDSLMDVLFS